MLVTENIKIRNIGMNLMAGGYKNKKTPPG